MIKKLLAFVGVLITGSVMMVAGASASGVVNIGLNHAYLKNNGSYDIVVKDAPGVKLALYVNDKNPVVTTVNRKDWATFRGVKIADTGKISFARVFITKGKTYQKPLRYVRYFQIINGVVTFQNNPSATPPAPAPVVPVQPVTPQKKVPAPAPAPKPTPAPQPTCTNGTYVNSAGNTVCSPETTPSAPAGATAQCVDGTYSFSQSRSGTCSHHGGVASWL